MKTLGNILVLIAILAAILGFGVFTEQGRDLYGRPVLFPIYAQFAYSEGERRFQELLNTRVETGTTEVPLSELVPESWDTVCALKPYSQNLSSLIQADISGFDTSSLDLSSDNAWAFVFIRDHKIALAIRTYGKFKYSQQSPSNCLGRNAVLDYEAPNKMIIKGK